MGHSISIWDADPALTVQLRALANTERTAQQIADMLGNGISRSAVLSRARRLNIKFKNAEVIRARIEASRIARLEAGKVVLLAKPKSAPVIPLRIDSKLLTLETLPSGGCKFPYGDPGTDAFHFCGHPQKKDRPFCIEHSKIAYQPINNSAPKRDAAQVEKMATVTGLRKIFG